MHMESQGDAPASRKQRRRHARRKQRALARQAVARHENHLQAASSPAPIAPRGPRRSFLQQIEEVLTRIERGARELRNVAQGAAGAIEFGKTKLSEGKGMAEVLMDRAMRLHKTSAMLAQLVLGYRLIGLRSAFSSRERTEQLWHELHASNASRFTRVSLEQGGAFLKVGQLLSARADLLPGIWIHELSSLQDAAVPIPADQARGVLEQAFGATLDARFAAFESTPLAAASIGEVHRARTADGADVVVKIQRPGIGARIEDDLALLDLTCDALRSMLPPIDLDTIIQEIRQHVRAEVDYPRETDLTERAARFFAHVPGIVVPEPLREFCTQNVITTRFIEGRKITLVLDELSTARAGGDKAAHERLSRLLGQLLEGYLRQIFELGTFQADPHPGNLLVTADDEVAILDFGCAAELPDAVRRGYLSLLSAFFAGDREQLAQILADLGFRTRSGQPRTLIAFMDALLGELAQALQSGRFTWPDRAVIAERAQELGQSLSDDPVVSLPRHFVMLGRVLATLGGLFSYYRPDLDVGMHVLPVLAGTVTTSADPAATPVIA